MSLGICLNNPMNIRYNGFNKWQGLCGNEKGFCKFATMRYGLRAGIITLRTYINKHHLKDVESLVSRFAPASENNTRAYISYVSSALRSLGYDPDNIVFGSDAFCLLVVSMCMYESWYRCSVNDIMNIIKQFKLM